MNFKPLLWYAVADFPDLTFRREDYACNRGANQAIHTRYTGMWGEKAAIGVNED